MTALRLVCGWCKAVLREAKPGEGEENKVSHGICDECARNLRDSLNKEETGHESDTR